ncbi:hypothetical protein M011DRAFT_135794 [Sporormia fimetaria CBS 119925]|uniref:BHLH domain-containing protein n=1 Tax=Sporormia fimetaria CBS 119925 TaxID=1340428 RepID=A0A6A6V6S5_9PLEO|nr:hypothetical protein M011DRAFT_135794 [Sporormia fimetaria CBS 119925]
MAPEIPASDLPYRGPPHSLPSTSGVHGYGAAAPENNSYTNQRGPINVSSSFRAPHQGSVSGAELTDSRRKRRKLDENPYGLGQGDDVDESRITDEEHKTRRKAEQEGRRRISEKDRRVCEDRSLEIIKKLVPACQKRTRGTMWKWEVLVATVEHLQAVKKSIQDKEERFQSLVGELQAMKVRNQDLERGLGAAYLRKLEEYVEKLEDMMKTEKQRSHTLQVRVDFLEQVSPRCQLLARLRMDRQSLDDHLIQVVLIQESCNSTHRSTGN